VIEGKMDITKKLIIQNEFGLHARAAALIVQVAGKYKSSITFERDGQKVDGKSLLDILTLACPKGGRIIVNAVGVDAEKAVEHIEKVVENKFGEN
jgi:phosphocarrier protein HPr